ncbi:MAG: sugar ABC transporter permease [Ilumatobacteraceae bacterium]|nr:sugar ABC transporter permease [Ilumatobacteraceae bacterium]
MSASTPAIADIPALSAAARRIVRRRQRRAALLTVPSWLMLAALFAVPILVGVYLSTRSDKIGSFVPGRGVGLDNFRRDVFDEGFVAALATTLIITLIGLAIQLPVGIGLAVVLNRNLRGTRFFRTALLLPMLLTPVAVGLMWRFMLDTDLGVINWLLDSVGLSRIGWLGEKWAARVSIALVDSWQSIPFVMLMTLAALSTLPEGPHEAARIDGASTWRVFRFVTLPMLRPVLYITLMIRLVDSLKLFDIIFILTRGAPGRATETIGLLTYNTGFNFLQTGRAAALGVAVAILTLPVYVLWLRAQRSTR